MPFIRKVRVLCKTRLIFPRINGPNVFYSSKFTVLGLIGRYSKGYSKINASVTSFDKLTMHSILADKLETFDFNQPINQSFILTRYVEELKNSFKIRTCMNKTYNNYTHIIILFYFKNNSINI